MLLIIKHGDKNNVVIFSLFLMCLPAVFVVFERKTFNLGPQLKVKFKIQYQSLLRNFERLFRTLKINSYKKVNERSFFAVALIFSDFFANFAIFQYLR